MRRHAGVVRVTHWITAACFAALLVSGIEIVISHPRFYWGETGNVNVTPLFKIPIPSSRATVPTGYGYVMTDQNGWSRALHFQSAWLVVVSGLLYVGWGLMAGHFRRNFLPHPARAAFYNRLQGSTYAGVVFVLFPLVVWTGLAMSPAVAAAVPPLVTVLGGQQSARTIHFFVSGLLSAFFVVHVVMVGRSGFVNQMRGMITGQVAATRGEEATA